MLAGITVAMQAATAILGVAKPSAPAATSLLHRRFANGPFRRKAALVGLASWGCGGTLSRHRVAALEGRLYLNPSVQGRDHMTPSAACVAPGMRDGCGSTNSPGQASSRKVPPHRHAHILAANADRPVINSAGAIRGSRERGARSTPPPGRIRRRTRCCRRVPATDAPFRRSCEHPPRRECASDRP
jgi:hypothetical protein